MVVLIGSAGIISKYKEGKKHRQQPPATTKMNRSNVFLLYVFRRRQNHVVSLLTTRKWPNGGDLVLSDWTETGFWKNDVGPMYHLRPGSKEDMPASNKILCCAALKHNHKRPKVLPLNRNRKNVQPLLCLWPFLFRCSCCSRIDGLGTFYSLVDVRWWSPIQWVREFSCMPFAIWSKEAPSTVVHPLLLKNRKKKIYGKYDEKLPNIYIKLKKELPKNSVSQ